MSQNTSKERDAETGLDYFGARYYSGAQGRFMSPDWSETPQPVPYADLSDPQTLNLYSYVRNNPLAITDPDGHEIKYANGLRNEQLVRDTVRAILENPQTSANLSGYDGKNNPDLTIQSGNLSAGDTKTVLPSGQTVTTTVQGNMEPNIQTTIYTSNGVTSSPETQLKSATITIDNRTSAGNTPGVLIHEVFHAGEAKTNPAQFLKDATAERSLPHDQRPQERRANEAQRAYTREIKRDIRQIQRDRKNP